MSLRYMDAFVSSRINTNSNSRLIVHLSFKSCTSETSSKYLSSKKITFESEWHFCPLSGNPEDAGTSGQLFMMAYVWEVDLKQKIIPSISVGNECHASFGAGYFENLSIHWKCGVIVLWYFFHMKVADTCT